MSSTDRLPALVVMGSLDDKFIEALGLSACDLVALRPREAASWRIFSAERPPRLGVDDLVGCGDAALWVLSSSCFLNPAIRLFTGLLTPTLGSALSSSFALRIHLFGEDTFSESFVKVTAGLGGSEACEMNRSFGSDDRAK